jgi:hypothetical protein
VTVSSISMNREPRSPQLDPAEAALDRSTTAGGSSLLEDLPLAMLDGDEDQRHL